MPPDRRRPSGSLPGPRRHSPGRPRRRDRRGRGLRGELAPRDVPLWRSPGEEFDDLVLDAVEDLEQQWSTDLESVEFAVEDVPSVVGGEFDPEVVADHGVPLGRLYRDGLDGVRTPVIVVYRRPVEARAHEGVDRSDLVFAVVTELVAELLGRDPDEFG